MGSRTRSFIPSRKLLGLLLGTVVLPALGALSLGIIALALQRAGFDIVLGVLILVFAVLSCVGGLITLAFVRRSARLAQMQTDFVANVSHELRTPLAGIRLLVETLARGRADNVVMQDEVFALLQDRVGNLEGLVARILKWQHLEAGVHTFDMQPLVVADLIEEAIAPYIAPSMASSIDNTSNRKAVVRVDVGNDLPRVHGDRAALIDAIRNLVDNAIKFGGDAGPVDIRVHASEANIVMSVYDHGPGIPPVEHQRIFERFYRVPGQSRQKQGTGLGLAIVSQVVAAHHGRILLESEPEKGSLFMIQLPTLQQPRSV